MNTSPLTIAHTCKHCGGSFFPKRTDRLQYCSRECLQDMNKKRGAEQTAPKLALLQRLKATNESLRIIGRCMSDIKATNEHIRLYYRNCAECGIPYVAKKTMGCIKIYCSERCKSAKTMVVTRVNRYTRKVRKRIGAAGAVIEQIRPIEVMEKFGFKCQYCGIETPLSLRATNKPNSPELDHIIPLSKGGNHTMDNITLSCRKCNIHKSDSIIYPGGVEANSGV